MLAGSGPAIAALKILGLIGVRTMTIITKNLHVCKVLTDSISLLSLAIAAFSSILMVVLVIIGIIARELFGIGVPATTEYATYCVVAVGVGGCAYTLRKGAHVNVDLILRMLPIGIKNYVVFFGYLASLVFFLIPLTVVSFKMAMSSLEHRMVVMYPTETLLGYPQLLLGFFLLLFTLQLLIEIWRQAQEIFFAQGKLLKGDR